MLVAVLGPDEPGERILEIDLVHEFVRRFGCTVRKAIVVSGGPPVWSERRPSRRR